MSASPDLLQQSSESLAGRIAIVELTPLLAEEVTNGTWNPEALDRLWVRGGFPESFLTETDADSHEWRLTFIQTYLERDIPTLGPRIPAETLRRFWTMLAHDQGSLLNAARLAAALGVSGQSVARYLDLLVDLLLVRRLAPWSTNAGKRLVRSPKVYIRDSGLVHALLRLPTLDMVLGHPIAGEARKDSSWRTCSPRRRLRRGHSSIVRRRGLNSISCWKFGQTSDGPSRSNVPPRLRSRKGSISPVTRCRQPGVWLCIREERRSRSAGGLKP